MCGNVFDEELVAHQLRSSEGAREGNASVSVCSWIKCVLVYQETCVSDANTVCQVLVILRVGGVVVIEELVLKSLVDLSTHHPDARGVKNREWVGGRVVEERKQVQREEGRQMLKSDRSNQSDDISENKGGPMSGGVVEKDARQGNYGGCNGVATAPTCQPLSPFARANRYIR